MVGSTSGLGYGGRHFNSKGATGLCTGFSIVYGIGWLPYACVALRGVSVALRGSAILGDFYGIGLECFGVSEKLRRICCSGGVLKSLCSA